MSNRENQFKIIIILVTLLVMSSIAYFFLGNEQTVELKEVAVGFGRISQA